MRHRLLAAGLSGAFLLCGQTIPVTEHMLGNGMKILIHEDHDIPNVALYFFFRVGSRNERSGATGMSHFFEHMMFNGAKKYGPKQFDIVMERNGGNNNAYTSHDITVYTDWFPAAALETMFDMEADRIGGLAIDPKMVESERGVVYSERRTAIDNDNAGLLFENLWAQAFLAHPYHWPIIGWASDIESWTLADLRAHYRMGYAPNNCVMVVTGAVKEAEVLRLARKYMEPIPRQEPPPTVRTKEPEQRGERRVVVRKETEAPMLAIAWHAPETAHADSRAVEILARLLTRGRSSRLYQALIDAKPIAIQAEAQAEDNVDPTIFTVFAQLRPGVEPGEAEAAIDREVARLATEPVSATEIEKVRNQVLSEFYRGVRTIAGKANLIGRAEIYLGSYKKLETYAADLARVTPEDVKRVAAKYLTRENRTVGLLIAPEAPGQEASR
ncbi:MAG: pitrilysin family protein [Bryobacteraceae bacterium]